MTESMRNHVKKKDETVIGGSFAIRAAADGLVVLVGALFLLRLVLRFDCSDTTETHGIVGGHAFRASEAEPETESLGIARNRHGITFRIVRRLEP
ncbi:hypothetical protein F2Q69_00051195 [Brassica cretica]|uniref:Uncharacterized protein n=1 Tax=Brassica cretica TaxID=69181 RepID=A0A8S9PUG2_BRACR|nr:hypothetical protein F2Q69_00051195 [Brassica cretica]